MADGPARFALYWAPDPADPLHAAGAAWLGRDPESGAACPQPDLPDIAAITADPRRYGFHATLKPPMRLRPGISYDQLVRAAAGLAATLPAFALPPLAVANLDGFLALRETEACPALHALADACVTALDAYRAPPDAAELVRRHAAGLSEAEAALLARWGYPYVLESWRFHMTLSRRLTQAEHARLRPAADAHFAAALARPRAVDAITLFTQRAPDAPFLIAERFPLQARPGALPLNPAGAWRPPTPIH
jgi:putative phosphonate metabolism protein